MSDYFFGPADPSRSGSPVPPPAQVVEAPLVGRRSVGFLRVLSQDRRWLAGVGALLVLALAGAFALGRDGGGKGSHDYQMRDLGDAAAISILASGNNANLATCGIKFASLMQERSDLVQDDIRWFTMGCLQDGSEDQRFMADMWDIQP